MSAILTAEKKTRIEWIDILRGFMMFFVIYGHNSCNGLIHQQIYSFHMPVFFIISGMTFCFNKETRILPYIKKKMKGLLLPYILLNIYVAPFWYLGARFGDYDRQAVWKLVPGILLSQERSGFHMASNTTWFITCLFIVDILFFLIWKIFKKKRYITAAVVALTLASYLLGILRLPGAGIWHCETAFTAIVFYLFGYLFLKNIDKIQNLLEKIKAGAILLIIGLFALGLGLSWCNGPVSMIGDYYKNVPVFYLSALSSGLGFILLFMLLSRHKAFLKIMKPVDFVGKTTLPYIAFQVPLMRVIRMAIPYFSSEAELNRILLPILFFFAFMPLAWLIKTYLLPGAKWVRDLHHGGKGSNGPKPVGCLSQ